MTRATKYIREAAQYVLDSGATVEIDRSFSWVAINIPDYDGVFFQGEAAEEFIAEVDALCKRYPSLDEDTAALSLAKGWVENCN